MGKQAPPDPTGAVVDEEEEQAPSRGGEVQVDLEEKGKEPPAPEKKPDPEAAERRWKAIESQVAATRRINEDLRKQVQTLNERLQQAPKEPSGAEVLPKGTSQETIDKYDQLVADGKWQEAVRVLSREEYKTAREIERAQEQVQAAESRRLSALERSKQKVRESYPALHEETGDPEAPETTLYLQAVAELSKEDDQFIHDPYAPELAMTRMEQLARTQGVALRRAAPISSPGRTPGRQTSVPASRGSGGASSYTLTREQKEWCDTNLSHLPVEERYKHYARFAKVSETEGGVEA